MPATVKGPEACLAVQVTLDTLCSVCPHVLTPHDVEPARAQDPSVGTLATWCKKYCALGAQEVVVLDLKAATDRRATKRVDNRKVPAMKRTKTLRRGGLLKSPRLAAGSDRPKAGSDRPAAEPAQTAAPAQDAAPE